MMLMHLLSRILITAWTGREDMRKHTCHPETHTTRVPSQAAGDLTGSPWQSINVRSKWHSAGIYRPMKASSPLPSTWEGKGCLQQPFVGRRLVQKDGTNAGLLNRPFHGKGRGGRRRGYRGRAGRGNPGRGRHQVEDPHDRIAAHPRDNSGQRSRGQRPNKFHKQRGRGRGRAPHWKETGWQSITWKEASSCFWLDEVGLASGNPCLNFDGVSPSDAWSESAVLRVREGYEMPWEIWESIALVVSLHAVSNEWAMVK